MNSETSILTDILSRLKNAQKHLKRTGRPLVTLSYAQCIMSILRNHLADQLVLTIAPVYIGGLTAVGSMQLDLLAPPRIRNAKHKMFGDDMVLRTDLLWEAL